MSFDLDALLTRHHHDPTRLVQILRDVAAVHNRVAPADITRIAAALKLPRAHVEGVTDFYSFLGSKPRGRYHVLFSDNITDEMAGSANLRQRLLDAFELKLGQVTRDGLLSVDLTSCTGLCDQGPALLVNGTPIPRLTPARIGAISALIRAEVPIAEWPENLFPIHTHIYRKDLILGTPLAPGEGLAAAMALGADEALNVLTTSDLRGRGGAGFAMATKLRSCRGAPKHPKVIVCNADEGEPGTFKDRVLLNDYADLVIEGMTTAAFLTGASRGFIYLRGEYPFLAPHLEAVLARRREQNLLGHHIAGTESFDFDIEIHLGAGAYVCGEESALIESLEGKRGIPRNRPPYPTTHGYLGLPTAVNNVETLAALPLIMRYGEEWWRSRGTMRSTGTKVHSVSGDVARPGIYEFPKGVEVREILQAAGAKNILAVQVGGPSGTLLGANELHRRIAMEEVPSAGALMVFDDTRDILQIISNFSRVFAHESCGFCPPCRVGTTLVKQMTERLASGRGTRRDIKDLPRVAQIMRSASQCGLGHTAANPVLDALAKFRPAFERQISLHEFLPMFDLDEALAPAREVTGREDEEAHLREEAP